MSAHYSSQFYSSIVLDSIKNKLANTPTYMFVSTANGQSTEPNQQQQFEVVNKILFGKKIRQSDIRLMVKRVNWTANTVYSMYDDQDSELESKNFFVLSSNRSVYKCLNNNRGAKSIYEPMANDPYPFQLADGYIWKYMYKLSTFELSERCTTNFITVVDDTVAASQAVDGAISSIIVTSTGSGYLTANGIISSVVSNNVFQLANTSSAANGAFINSSIYITGGPGVGQTSLIRDHYNNNLGRFVVTDSALPGVTNNSTYTIAPTVFVNGSGTGAKVKPKVANGMITEMELLSTGHRYRSANLSVYANGQFGSGASARVVISPSGGHGKDSASELFARHLSIGVKIKGTEGNTIPVDVKFSSYGLITNLKQFANNSANYLANTFNATSEITYTPLFGTITEGMTLRKFLQNDTTAVAISTAGNTALIIQTSDARFAANDQVIGDQTSLVKINTISSPDIVPLSGNLLMYAGLNTITRDEDSQEMINIILRV